MNDEQLNRLLARARQTRRDTSRVELGFETRLLARLRAQRAAAVPWFAWAWRLIPVFAAITLAVGIWTYQEPGGSEWADWASNAVETDWLLSWMGE